MTDERQDAWSWKRMKRKVQKESPDSMKPNRMKRFKRAVVWLLAVLLVVTAGCSGAGGNDAANGSSRQHNTGTSAGGEAPSAGDRALEPSPEGESSGGGTHRGGGIAAEQAAPGQLTAGEWRDIAEWERWQQLLGSYEGRDNQRYWQYQRFDRLVVRATAGGIPVVDAEVIVRDAEERIVWRAKTDIDGYAYAYAELFGSQGGSGNEPAAERRQSNNSVRRGEGYDVEVRSGNETKRYDNVPIPRSETLEAAFETGSRLSAAVDLMFVVDTTGSMQDEIDFLREELKDVIGRVRERDGANLEIAISTNFYRDRYDDYVVKPYPFTDRIDQAIEQIAAERAEGGGDYPEAVEEALRNAVSEHTWRRDARARLLFLVLDAPPHRKRGVLEELHDVTQEAAALGIRIVPVASSGVDVNTEYLMRFLSASTGGTYVFLTDHSGIGNDHLEAAVGEYEVRPLNDLLVDIIRRYTGTDGSGQ